MSELTREQIKNRFEWISRQLSSDQSTQDRLNELKVLALAHLESRQPGRVEALEAVAKASKRIADLEVLERKHGMENTGTNGRPSSKDWMDALDENLKANIHLDTLPPSQAGEGVKP